MQISPQRGAQIRVVSPGTANNTAMNFINGSGPIGSITNTASGTAFNTTSDERLKTPHGEITNVLDTITRLVDTGAVQLAAFKSEPENITPMFLAQRTGEVIPEMVTTGSGEPGDDGFMPYSVDKAAITPYLVAAIYELYEIIKKSGK